MPSILSLCRPDEKAHAVACAVEAAIRPARVILFGSRARGDFDAASDIDLLVINGLIPLNKQFVYTVAYRKAKQAYGQSVEVDLVHMSEADFYYGRCERNRIAGQAVVKRGGQGAGAEGDARGMTHAERMHGRMLAVGRDMVKRYNGCDYFIRRWLANHFGTAPNGAYEAAMAAVRLRRGYGTDSHRFEDSSGALWTWDEDGKGDQITVWAVRADMDREIDDAVGEVARELRGFNGFWMWEMERRDRLGEPQRPVAMKEGEQILKEAERLMNEGLWVDKFICGWKERGAGRAERARLGYQKTLLFLIFSAIPKPANRATGEIDIFLMLWSSKRSFAPLRSPADYAPSVRLVHKTIAAQVATQQYAVALVGFDQWNQSLIAAGDAYRYGAIAMGLDRP